MNRNHRPVVRIKKIVNGGYGLAQSELDKTILVRFALPGEKLQVRFTERRRRFDFAETEVVIEAHPGRTVPPCPYYGSCGGCDLQHADYRTQLELKTGILQDLLQRHREPAINRLSAAVRQPIPSPEPFHYRQRIRLASGGPGVLGYKRHRSHQIVTIDRCLLAAPGINDCLQQLQCSACFERMATITDELQLLLDPSDGGICLMLSLKRPPRPTDRRLARELGSSLKPPARIFLAGSAFATEGPYGPPANRQDNRLCLDSRAHPLTGLCWEAGAFCQVNLAQNRNLVESVLSAGALSRADLVLDLFCGMGNLSLPLAQNAASVLGIESQGASIRSAKANAMAQGIPNAQFIKQKVASTCRELTASGHRYHTVVCDPPRSGISGLAPELARLTAHRLIYVSCDPATLIRDLGELHAGGLRCMSLHPMDMFPQTHHLETVAILEKH